MPTLNAALDHLRIAHPPFAPLIARVARPPPPSPPLEPFEALIRAIAHQQLHGNAARAILARFAALVPDPPAPAAVLALEASALRACGFSASKAAAIRDLCAKTLDGTVPTLAAARGLDDAALIGRLCTLRGVGRWTVEMLLMTALDRPDILPVDDFGIRDGWRVLNGLPARPTPKELAAIGQAWSPYRSTAAWYLWRASDEGKAVKQPG